MSSIEHRVRVVIGGIFGTPFNDVTLEKSLRGDLKFDPLSIAELVLRIEAQFGSEIGFVPEGTEIMWQTVEDIVHWITKTASRVEDVDP